MTGRPRARLSRLPLRVRLVTGFSAAMFVVLVAAGAFVYWRVDFALDRGLDVDLERQATTVSSLVQPDGRVGNRASAEASGAAWQVLDSGGTVLDHGGAADETPFLTAHQLTRTRLPHTGNVGALLPASPQPYRLRVVRLSGSPERYLVVGVRRDHRDEALRELLAQLGLAGAGALVVTAFVGERLARAALRPVETYRTRAAAIAAGSGALRLDVPAGRDDEITRLGHTFNEMLAALAAALDRERQFVNEASHELRTPITLLTGRVQLALRRPRTPAEHEQVLAELEVDLRRLSELAEQLLQLGDAAGRPGTRRCDLGVVAARIAGQRRASTGPDSAGNLVVRLPAAALPVALAEMEVERVLGNLLDNASVHGAPPLALTVDEAQPGWARIRASDEGPGMPPDLLATATQRFARADEARSRPGSGLGLSLVEALVASAGGELRLCCGGHHSVHGRRVPVACAHGPEMTVTVLLPLADESAPPHQAAGRITPGS